jgi:hypothetical protein
LESAGFLPRRPGAGLDHDPEKWNPVFGQDHGQTKIEPRPDVIGTDQVLDLEGFCLAVKSNWTMRAAVMCGYSCVVIEAFPPLSGLEDFDHSS